MKVTFELPGDTLPEHCYDCPIHSATDGSCQADPAGRVSDWRPFWCPLASVPELIESLHGRAANHPVLGDIMLTGKEPV